jgi:hypothetical protein
MFERPASDPCSFYRDDYSRLSALLIEAVKEQQIEIETLENAAGEIASKK